MGAATAEVVASLGADVIVVDRAPVPFATSRSENADIGDRSSIDDLLDRLPGPIHAVFSCVGVADPTPGLMQINFLGQRHLIEGLVERDLLRPGAAIAMISSTAGLGWERNLDVVNDLLDTPDFDKGVAWVAAHADCADYRFSKQAMCAYVAREAFPLIKRGIRINAIQPGPTDTPLTHANADKWLTSGQEYRDAAGVAISKPEEQATILAFLCSDAARYLTGANIVTDCGRTAGRLMHGFPPPYSME